jgi:DNA-binding MarR family transcriptional regulator
MTREPVPTDKRRVAYRLTEKGLGLVPVMIALRQWGERWGAGGNCTSGPVLSDARDRKPIRPITIQAWDGRTLERTELCWVEQTDGASAPVRCTGPSRDRKPGL